MAQLVTIGITAFNAVPTIERAVRSALAQSWRPIEIVVMDDCSSDATPEILASLSSQTSGNKIIPERDESGSVRRTKPDIG